MILGLVNDGSLPLGYSTHDDARVFTKNQLETGKEIPCLLAYEACFFTNSFTNIASFRASLSYRITTAEKLRTYGTIYDRARLPPRETDHIYPKVREFSTARHAQGLARGDSVSREKGSTYDTIRAT